MAILLGAYLFDVYSVSHSVNVRCLLMENRSRRFVHSQCNRHHFCGVEDNRACAIMLRSSYARFCQAATDG